MYNKSLESSGIIALSAGAILGHLFEMRFVNLNLSYSHWTKTNYLFVGIRVMISSVIYLICALPYFLMNSDVDSKQIYSLWLLKHTLPSFLCPFLLFAFGRLLFFKLKLVSERSIGRMFEMHDEEDDFTVASSSTKHANSAGSLEFIEMELAHKV